MATTPTSMVNRLMGLETWTDAVNFGSVAHTFSGAVIFSGNPAFSGTPTYTNALALPAATTIGGQKVDLASRLVTVPPATTTLSLTAALHGGNILNLAPTGGLAITLPAPTGTGVLFTLFCSATVTGGNLTIDAKGGDASANFAGIAFQNKTGTGITTTPTAATTNLITLNGSTGGGILGDEIQILDAGTHAWNLYIMGQYTGTFASPFSNH